MKDCGVFGVSSKEYLDYALKNRAEWVIKGEEVTSKIAEKARRLWYERHGSSEAVENIQTLEEEGQVGAEQGMPTTGSSAEA